MKTKSYYGVITYTVAGFSLGLTMIILGVLLNYNNGFNGPWFHIFDYAPDFIIIVFSPVYLSLLFCFIGVRREQLVLFNRLIKYNLSQEQENNTAADTQIKLLAKIIGQVSESIIISDNSGKVQWVNEGFTNILGYQLDEIKGKEINTFLHGPLTDILVADRMVGKLKKGEALTEEILTYHKKGNTIWLSISIKPIFDDNGNVENYIAIQHDISSRKEREIAIEALYKEIADYKFALDQSSIVIIFDIDGKIIHVNDKFCVINESERNTVLGKDYRSISISMRDKAIVKPIWEALYKGVTWKGELINRTKNGKTYWTDTTIVPVMDSDGMPHHFLSIQKDITKRKTLEEQLETNLIKLQLAMQVAQLGAWEIDVNGVLTLSEELRTLYQLPKNKYVPIEEIYANIPGEDLLNIKERLSIIKLTHKNEEVEYRYNINGKTHYMASTFTIQVDLHGNYIGTFGTVQDITSKNLTALALKKSEEEKASILNHTQTLMCVHEMDGTLIDMNPAAERVTGFNKEDIIGKNLRLIIAPNHYAELDAYFTKIKTDETVKGQMKILTKCGEERVWLYQNTVYANNGNEPYVIASAIDITDTVKAQREIGKQQRLIHQIIDDSPNVIFMLDTQGQILLANQLFTAYYPFNEKDTPLITTLCNKEDDLFLGNKNQLLQMEEGQIIRKEGSLVEPLTGKSTWFTIIYKCFSERNGQKYILCFGMDITSRHLIETDLIEAHNLVEKSLKVKEEFISNMSHEIRTPLNAVIGFTDLLSETPLNAEQNEYLDIVKTASGNLLALINNVLDLSKIESKNIALESTPISIQKVINDVIKILEPKAKKKELLLSKHFATNLPLKVMGDQLRLTQILFNLLGNAVKFTHKGTIYVGCKCVEGPDTEKAYLSFTVKDTGIGVSQDNQANIFERFTQANIDTQRLYGGTGLGLNITKSIINLYGGTLTMESELGIGTTFNFMLPFKKFVEPLDIDLIHSFTNNEILDINTKHPVHILLAEDNMVNAMLATKVLTKKGFTLKHVVNGMLAVEAVQQQHFDLVLMDIQMPVMNGISATMAIRNLDNPVSKIPIIAMTAYSLNGEMENCFNNGMNGYVAKPFKAIDLFSTIMEVIKN